MRSLIAAAVGVAAGLWMMVAPAVLGYSGSGATNDRIVGPAAAAVAWVAASETTRSVRWINLPVAVWVLVSPLFLNYPDSGAIHAVLSGITLLLSTAAIERIPSERYAGGWRTLMDRPQRTEQR